MQVHLEINIGVLENCRSLLCGTVLRVRRIGCILDRIVSVTFGGSVGIVVDEVQRDPVDVNSIWLQVPEISNGKHRGAESGDRSKHR